MKLKKVARKVEMVENTMVENSVKSPKVIETDLITEEPKKIIEELSIAPCNLNSLLDKSYAIASECTDYLLSGANSSNIRLNSSGGITYQTQSGKVHNATISRFALGQLGTKIGVPARYLEKCIASGRIDLAQDNVNSWLEDYNKDLFIREHKGKIRGVLSNRYSVCDSHEILEAVDNALDLNSFKIKGSFLTPERLHVRMVSKEMLPIQGEDLFAGLFIDSSDVGRSILTVKFGIYKQICTNGLTVSKAGGVLFQQKHIGITAEEFYEGLVKSLDKVEVLTENAIEWINLAKSKSAYGYNFKSMSQEDMEEFIARVRSVTNFPEESAHKVFNLMQTKYDTSKWGFINGITEVAQDFTLERRIDLEKIAGDLLVR